MPSERVLSNGDNGSTLSHTHTHTDRSFSSMILALLKASLDSFLSVFFSFPHPLFSVLAFISWWGQAIDVHCSVEPGMARDCQRLQQTSRRFMRYLTASTNAAVATTHKSGRMVWGSDSCLLGAARQPGKISVMRARLVGWSWVLAGVKPFSWGKIREVCMVCPYHKALLNPFQLVPPLLHSRTRGNSFMFTTS